MEPHPAFRRSHARLDGSLMISAGIAEIKFQHDPREALPATVLVPFARPGRSKAQSFPRKRESSFPSARFQELENWIPAFAGMTAVSKGIRCQMTQVPRRLDHSN